MCPLVWSSVILLSHVIFLCIIIFIFSYYYVPYQTSHLIIVIHLFQASGGTALEDSSHYHTHIHHHIHRYQHYPFSCVSIGHHHMPAMTVVSVHKLFSTHPLNKSVRLFMECFGLERLIMATNFLQAIIRRKPVYWNQCPLANVGGMIFNYCPYWILSPLK